jgi:uncharacterized protein YcgL (UPF0745 family)
VTRRLVQIYKGSRKPEAYLYVDKARGLADVPETLLAQFGDTSPVMAVLLDEQRKLARASAVDVLAQIEAQGYYLQMPPTAAELLAREGSRDR